MWKNKSNVQSKFQNFNLKSTVPRLNVRFNPRSSTSWAIKPGDRLFIGNRNEILQG